MALVTTSLSHLAFDLGNLVVFSTNAVDEKALRYRTVPVLYLCECVLKG